MRPRYWVNVLSGVFLVALLCIVGSTLRGPEPVMAFVWLVFAGGFAWPVSRSLVRPWRRTTFRIELVDNGFLIVQRDVEREPEVTALVLVLGAGAGVVVGVDDGDGALVTIGAVVLVVTALVYFGLVARGLREPRGLLLTQDGVRWRSRWDDRFLAWDELDKAYSQRVSNRLMAEPGLVPIIVLRPRWGVGMWARVQSRTRRWKVPADWDRMLEIPVIQLSAPPALVLWLVRHYHEHPADRAELGTELALDRIRRG